MSEDHQFQKLCDSIFALNTRIRFVGIIDRMGKLVAGGMREKVHQASTFHLIGAVPE